VFGGRGAVERIPVTLTCGTAEENLANNRALAAALRLQGWLAPLVEHPDAHNWVSWRDSLHPHLAELMLRAATGGARTETGSSPTAPTAGRCSSSPPSGATATSGRTAG